VEFTLLIAGVAAGVIGAATILGTQLNDTFQAAVSMLVGT
jgi:Flp pilus assembly pilin Flp